MLVRAMMARLSSRRAALCGPRLGVLQPGPADGAGVVRDVEDFAAMAGQGVGFLDDDLRFTRGQTVSRSAHLLAWGNNESQFSPSQQSGIVSGSQTWPHSRLSQVGQGAA